MSCCYIPITITVWKSDVCLFQCECEARVEYDLPDGRSAGIIDWDVTAFWFDACGLEPGRRITTEIYRAEPLFKILYEHMDREYIDERLREALADSGIIDLYAVPANG